jgi:hypothetical protein
MARLELPAGHEPENPNCPACAPITKVPLARCPTSCVGFLHRDEHHDRMICDKCNHHKAIGPA